MIFICFHRQEFSSFKKYFKVLQIAQPKIILWLTVIGRSSRGAKELSILSLIIMTFVLACLAPSKPPLSGEAMISLCKFRMEHCSKGFVILYFTPDSASVIRKVSWDIGDSRTFELVYYPLHQCLSHWLANLFGSNNALFDRPFHAYIVGLRNQMSMFVEDFFLKWCALDILHQSKSLLAWTSFDLFFFWR